MCGGCDSNSMNSLLSAGDERVQGRSEAPYRLNGGVNSGTVQCLWEAISSVSQSLSLSVIKLAVKKYRRLKKAIKTPQNGLH